MHSVLRSGNKYISRELRKRNELQEERSLHIPRGPLLRLEALSTSSVTESISGGDLFEGTEEQAASLGLAWLGRSIAPVVLFIEHRATTMETTCSLVLFNSTPFRCRQRAHHSLLFPEFSLQQLYSIVEPHFASGRECALHLGAHQPAYSLST